MQACLRAYGGVAILAEVHNRRCGLRLLGWEVYTTCYVPDMALAGIAIIAVLLLVLAWWSRARTR